MRSRSYSQEVVVELTDGNAAQHQLVAGAGGGGSGEGGGGEADPRRIVPLHLEGEKLEGTQVHPRVPVQRV